MLRLVPSARMQEMSATATAKNAQVVFPPTCITVMWFYVDSPVQWVTVDNCYFGISDP